MVGRLRWMMCVAPFLLGLASGGELFRLEELFNLSGATHPGLSLAVAFLVDTRGMCSIIP